MWTIRGLINELDAVVIQKFSQNRLKKETVVKAAIIIHHDKMTTELYCRITRESVIQCYM